MTSQPHVLIVEDDERITRFLEQGLGKAGYRPSVARDAHNASRLLEAAQFDVIILDLLLPGTSGMDLCRKIRGQGMEVPILVLTAMDTVADRVEGLRSGADDYLTKPFAFDELLARIEALLRRGAIRNDQKTILMLDDLHVDIDARVARRGKKSLNLTPKEFRLLEHLLRNRGKVCSRTSILESVWNTRDDQATNVVDVYISHLRQKVDGNGSAPLIQTVRGFGYKIDRPPEAANRQDQV